MLLRNGMRVSHINRPRLMMGTIKLSVVMLWCGYVSGLRAAWCSAQLLSPALRASPLYRYAEHPIDLRRSVSLVFHNITLTRLVTACSHCGAARIRVN
jgi:hypothetical protein